ncbi:MAG TPA: phosphoribosylamine--glycine ligase [Methylomirabilota bacterium]|jgi:phosphoribosylamine--glycine ligase|nr:phosphoribosylamine--glycine ligase [Methylomirabilota bacterium]
MRVLLIGSGGREHALAWKIAQSPRLTRLVAAPGNPGIAAHASCVAVAVDDHDGILRLAERERVDLVVVGPETPLVAGLADRLRDKGLAVFGPGARASQLEGSKAFSKALMTRAGIPTARYATLTDAAAARDFCRALGAPLVVKADGLAGGKGAIVCVTLAEADEAIARCMERREFGVAGATIVVEEFLRGEEVSFFAIANGETCVPLAAAQDHKTVFDGDRGPNTGGMGVFTPVGAVDAALSARIMREIVEPTVAALARDDAPYRGVLFVGLMLTADGPKVLEYNVRFGDPECQAIMAVLDGDVLPLLAAAARGEALPVVRPGARSAVCVVVASGGYPDRYRTGLPITGLEAAARVPGVVVFHAGTASREGALVTAGGRVLGVTATAPDTAGAIAAAYEAVGRVRFDGMHYRGDIGRRAAAAQEAP